MKASFQKWKTKIGHTIKSNALIFCFFLMIATIFWFLVRLSDNYITNITYPVRYENFPENKINISELPEFFKIKVNAQGFDIVKFKLSSNFIPLNIDISSYELQSVNNDTSLMFLETGVLLINIQNQLKERRIIQDIDIIDINPDSIFMEFTSVIEKKIPVGLNADISFSNQYMLKDKIVIEPDSIIVKGPEKLIDTINYIKTEYLNLKNLNTNYESDVALVINDNMEFSTNKVILKIQVEEYTEKQINIPISIINVPDTLSLKIFPSEIKITYLVGFSNYGFINESKFESYVDFVDIQNTYANKLKIHIKNTPEQIKSYNYSPLNVEYILEK